VNSFLVLLSSTLLKKNGFYSLHYLIIPLCTYQYCFYLIIHTNYSAITFCSYFNPYSTLHPPSFCSNISYAYNNSYIYMHTLTITLEFTLSHIPCHNFFFFIQNYLTNRLSMTYKPIYRPSHNIRKSLQ
jgi:hypothetical protein